MDKLKIDPSFLPAAADGAAGESDTAVAATIIAMARELQLTVIAEGVETAQQLAYLRAQGCQQYQGRYASAQVEGSALARLLTLARIFPSSLMRASTWPWSDACGRPSSKWSLR